MMPTPTGLGFLDGISAPPLIDGSRQAGRLVALKGFGSDPGELLAWTYCPVDVWPNAPLVVVLHGAMQTALEYDHGAGWSRLADRHGFALLFPEQRRSNNMMQCFNWYGSADNQRASGEALSICQMTEATILRGGIDRGRVFVTGHSSGGAMAAVMLATYPETFAGGAVIGGLPSESAKGVFQAMDRMNGIGGPTAAELKASLRGASGYRGPWPVLSIWHGTTNRTVSISNVDAIAEQWRALHGVAASDVLTDDVGGYPRRTWCDSEGRPVIEIFSITGMGHGTPFRAGQVDGFGAYMLEARIPSSLHIARFWGIDLSVSVSGTVGGEPIALRLERLRRR